jgi:cytochrome bd ubiquinol oxidase subunit I
MSPDDFLHTLMRAQFGLSASFHFLFVPLSIGLLLCMNLLQTAFVLSKHPALERAARFWGRFFLLVWATGILTGYPLRWQLADLWAHYLEAATPVLKEIFAIEGTIAPLMIASVLIVTCARAVLPAFVIMLVGWFLLGLMTVQALTILSVNAWMQDPASVLYESGAWQLSSVSQVLLSETTVHKLLHTMSASMLTGAFFLFAIAGYFLQKGKHVSAAKASLGVAVWVGLASVATVLWTGHSSAHGVARAQPMKFAAFEGHWKAEEGAAPLVLFAIPDEDAGVNRHEIAIPYLMSLLSTGTLSSPPGILDISQDIEDQLRQRGDAHQHSFAGRSHARDHAHDIAGLDRSLNIPGRDQQRAWLRLRDAVATKMGERWATLSEAEQAQTVAKAARPPITPVFFAFRAMVGSGTVCMALCAFAFIKRRELIKGQRPGLLKLLGLAAPLPWIAIISGWAVAEMGRQPWTIYEHLPTFHASSLPTLQTGVGMFFFMLMAGVAIAVTFLLVARSIFRAGPDAEHWLDLGPAQRWVGDAVMGITAR